MFIGGAGFLKGAPHLFQICESLRLMPLPQAARALTVDQGKR